MEKRKEKKEGRKKGKTKRQIKIRRIEKKEARQVAFSKRRRGLFSKAEQLEQLCDAKVAAIIFSTAGRLYSYPSSSGSGSIEEIINTYNNKSLNQHQFQVLNRHYALLCEGVAKHSHELRQLKGEGLEGLGIDQLLSLEKNVESALFKVRNTIQFQESVLIAEVKTLEEKQAQLREENEKLRQIVMSQEGESPVHEQETNQPDPNLNPDSLPNNDYFVTLKLGMPSSDD